MATKLNDVTAPAGMYGLACEPWTPGEIYAVAANWVEASCPIRVYGEDGWTHDEHGRQVADFHHCPADALVTIIAEAITMGCDTPDDDEVAGIVSNAVRIDDVTEAAE